MSNFVSIEFLSDKWITHDAMKGLGRLQLVRPDGYFCVGGTWFGGVEYLHNRGGKWSYKASFDNLYDMDDK